MVTYITVHGIQFTVFDVLVCLEAVHFSIGQFMADFKRDHLPHDFLSCGLCEQSSLRTDKKCQDGRNNRLNPVHELGYQFSVCTHDYSQRNESQIQKILQSKTKVKM